MQSTTYLLLRSAPKGRVSKDAPAPMQFCHSFVPAAALSAGTTINAPDRPNIPAGSDRMALRSIHPLDVP